MFNYGDWYEEEEYFETGEKLLIALGRAVDNKYGDAEFWIGISVKYAREFYDIASCIYPKNTAQAYLIESYLVEMSNKMCDENMMKILDIINNNLIPGLSDILFTTVK